MYYLFVNELSMKAKDLEKNLADMIHVELREASFSFISTEFRMSQCQTILNFIKLAR